MTQVADDGFEVITTTEVDAEVSDTPTPIRVRKLCACGCGEEVTSPNRALKRGHTLGTGISTNWAPEDLLIMQTAICMLCTSVTAFIERKRDVPRMELEEAQGIANPAGRIAARHLPKIGKPGDFADGAAIIVAFTAYSLRVASTEKRSDNGNNGQQNNTPVSGLEQYTYTPPEIEQQENGITH